MPRGKSSSFGSPGGFVRNDGNNRIVPYEHVAHRTYDDVETYDTNIAVVDYCIYTPQGQLICPN